MAGVLATTGVDFRGGANAISGVSTLLVKLVDEKKLGLDNKLSKRRAEFAHTERVTPGQLAQTTSGYRDHTLSTAAVLFFSLRHHQANRTCQSAEVC